MLAVMWPTPTLEVSSTVLLHHIAVSASLQIERQRTAAASCCKCLAQITSVFYTLILLFFVAVRGVSGPAHGAHRR